MLTREKARKQPCRGHIESIEYDYHRNGDGVAYKIFHYHNCAANDCPKWVDCLEAGEYQCRRQLKCRKYASALKRKVHYPCDDCHHRYGRCGG